MARTKRIRPTDSILQKTQREMGEMSFEEIAVVMGMKNWQVERMFDRAMKKLKMPGSIANRILYEYDNITADAHVSDMAGSTL